MPINEDWFWGLFGVCLGKNGQLSVSGNEK